MAALLISMTKQKEGESSASHLGNCRLIQWSKIYNPQYILCHAQNIPSALLSKAGSIQNMGDFKNVICELKKERKGKPFHKFLAFHHYYPWEKLSLTADSKWESNSASSKVH